MGIFGGNSDNINIEVTLDADQAAASAKKLEDTIEKLGRSASEAGQGGFSRLQASIVTFNSAIGLAREAFDAIGSMVGSIKSLADAGENLGSLEAAFANLGGQRDVITDARERIKGLVSETDLLALANKALVVGLPDVNKNFGDIADVGGRLADALGRDVKETIEQVTQAIARGRPQQLAQLGLFVDTDKAIADYAATLGTTSDKLSDFAKKQALQEAAIEAVRNKLGELEPVGDGAANAIDSLSNTFTDIIGRFGIALNENESFTQSIRDLETALKNVDLDALAEDFSSFIDGLVNAGRAVITFWENFQRGLDVIQDLGVAFGALPGPIGFFARAVFDADEKLKGLNDTAKESEGVGKFVQALNTFEGSAADLNSYIDGLNKVKEAADKATPSLIKTGEKIKSIAQIVAAGVASDKITKSLESLTKLYQQGAISQEQLTAGLELLKVEFSGTKEEADAFQTAIEGINLATKETTTIIKNDLDSALYELQQTLRGEVIDLRDVQDGMRDVAAGMFKAQLAAIGLGDALDVLFEKQKQDADIDPGRGIADSLAAALGDAQSQAAISSALGDVFSVAGDVLFEALDLDASGLGYKIGQAAGTAVGAYFGGQAGAEAGGFLGGVLGSVVDKITGGTSDAGTLARRNIEGFIDDLISEINFQILDKQGDVIPFTDLILGDNSKFDAGSEFQARMAEAFAIDPSTFTAFQGVGGALGEIFAEDFAAGAQIGRVLFDEFGGNIDNLKLLFQELEVTAEEFQQALVDAFYKGEISALEFNSIIRDSSELFEEGISGVGQYQKAFEQFVASQGQGRLATQRLVDIFTEAEEAGVNGFDAIRQSLVDSGASTESVAQLFDTLAARGIGSVDQLRQASEQMRIAIVGDLQALNFEGFNDFSAGVQQSADEVGVLEERLKSLPEKVETQVTVKVNAEYENNEAREAFKLLGADAPGISR